MVPLRMLRPAQRGKLFGNGATEARNRSDKVVPNPDKKKKKVSPSPEGKRSDP
jgi:hypothetical protein